MLTQKGASAYQTAAASGATQAGVLQLVYASLATDLLRAAEATRRNDIEARCAASRHALLLLGHLESWGRDVGESALAESLHAFYSMLRTYIMQLQRAPQAAEFELLSRVVLDTRAAWQAKESMVLATHFTVPSASAAHTDRVSFHV